MEKEIAILMAAGLGSRMRPLTDITPKPLILVHGQPMIETMICGLKRRGIEEIYVVVGYLKEKFNYLTRKYPGLKLIENTEYQTKNNISSIYAVADVLKTSNCFICESDVYVSDPSIFDWIPDHSCYYAKKVSGYSDDWLFELDSTGRMTEIHKGGTDKFNMVGVAYFKQQDASILSQAIIKASQDHANDQLYWDEVTNANLAQIDMVIREVGENQLIELDTVEELQAIDTTY